MARNSTEHQDLKSGYARGLTELATPGAEVEVVSAMNMNSVELEAFMNEEVLIHVHKSREHGALEVIVPSVNGINMPIVRGVPTLVKRKYVEALARGHSVDYEQQTPDSSRPENIQVIEKRVASYPFDVREDSAKGKEWFRRLVASV